VFSKSSFSAKIVKYTLSIALYALHERRICSTVNGQFMSHSMACFLVLEEMRELNKCDRFVVCGVFALCVDQVDS